ncbi:MAG: methyltransferase domain-containing protein [Bacteriovorax sp.]|nr:methyltransferase domain-containing protein [Bacteriovorax sp.]
MKGLDSVKEYYGKILSTNKDLKTNACCLADSTPKKIREILKDIHPEVIEKFYGCGSPIPDDLEGKTVLDLGSGSGRDCYILSKLVGPSGKVIGVDMTDEQIEVAKKYIDYHTDKFGYKKSNVEFVKGYIEDLNEIGIATSSIDVVISNCVINLSPSKERVFTEIFRVLRPGGELYFSDVFSSRRIPEELVQNSVLMGECLSGALYTEDFRRLLAKIGCQDSRVLFKSKITIQNEEIERLVGRIEFSSITIRAFKLNLEDRCEDYGQFAVYLGTIKDSPNSFVLDDHHLFETNRPMAVCQNTAMMVSDTRYGKHFKIYGDTKTHFGLFDCSAPATTDNNDCATGACC